MYYSLPVKDRMNLMKHYKRAYPDMGYNDMVKHFSNGGLVQDLSNGDYTGYIREGNDATTTQLIYNSPEPVKSQRNWGMIGAGGSGITGTMPRFMGDGGEVQPYQPKNKVDFDYRQKMYNDSMNLYNKSQEEEKRYNALLDNLKTKKVDVYPIHEHKIKENDNLFKNPTRNVDFNDKSYTFNLPYIVHDTIRPKTIKHADIDLNDNGLNTNLSAEEYAKSIRGYLTYDKPIQPIKPLMMGPSGKWEPSTNYGTTKGTSGVFKGYGDGGKVEPYKPISQEDYKFRTKMYNDSLSLANLSRKREWSHPENPNISKEEFENLVKQENSYPYYSFNSEQYKLDKKRKKVDSFKDYIVKHEHGKDDRNTSITGKDLSEGNKANETNLHYLFKNFTDEKGRLHSSYFTDEIVYDNSIGIEDIYDPQTGTTIVNSYDRNHPKLDYILDIKNEHIKPTETLYKGNKNKRVSNEVSLSSKSTYWNSLKPNFKLENSSNEKYTNYTHDLEKIDLYPYPKQKILKPDKNAPKGTAITFKDYLNKQQPQIQTTSVPIQDSTKTNLITNTKPQQPVDYQTGKKTDYYTMIKKLGLADTPGTEKVMKVNYGINKYQDGGKLISTKKELDKPFHKYDQMPDITGSPKGINFFDGMKQFNIPLGKIGLIDDLKGVYDLLDYPSMKEEYINPLVAQRDKTRVK